MIPCSTNVAMGLKSCKENGFYQVRFFIYILIVMNKYNFILFKSSFVILYNLRLPCDKLDFFEQYYGTSDKQLHYLVLVMSSFGKVYLTCNIQ